MNIVLIDPDKREIRPALVPSFIAAKQEFLTEPCAAVYISDTHLLFYQPFAIEPANFFYSQKMEQHYAGKAFITKASLDGSPLSCGLGVLTAMQRDVVFLGNKTEAREKMKNMVRFVAGSMKAHPTTH